MATQVEAFYDDFSRRFIEDIVQGNERIAQQLNFFAKAIPSDAQRILVIGSGLMLVGNILSDIIYAFVDPRIRFR